MLLESIHHWTLKRVGANADWGIYKAPSLTELWILSVSQTNDDTSDHHSLKYHPCVRDVHSCKGMPAKIFEKLVGE